MQGQEKDSFSEYGQVMADFLEDVTFANRAEDSGGNW